MRQFLRKFRSNGQSRRSRILQPEMLRSGGYDGTLERRSMASSIFLLENDPNTGAPSGSLTATSSTTSYDAEKGGPLAFQNGYIPPEDFDTDSHSGTNTSPGDGAEAQSSSLNLCPLRRTL